MMENTETLPQKVVDRKTIILKSRLDPDAAKKLGEDKKADLFSKFVFLKPSPNDISLISLNQYYEPLMVIGGKYSIDYCRKRFFELKADDQVQKIYVGGEEFKFESSNSGKLPRVLKIAGEEHLHQDKETYFVLDRFMREFSPEKVHLAPFVYAIENPESSHADFKKVKISLEQEIAFLRSRLVKRPSDAGEIIKEVFEINERMIIYNPIYELLFQNVKNAKMVMVLVEGITGKLTVVKFDAIQEKLDSSEKPITKESSKVKLESFEESDKGMKVNDSINLNKVVKDSDQKTITKQETAATKIPEPEASFEAENAMVLAVASLKRLGVESRITPLKVSMDGELYVVELNLQDKSAKVWVNSKTKEIKEYEIQESNLAY